MKPLDHLHSYFVWLISPLFLSIIFFIPFISGEYGIPNSEHFLNQVMIDYYVKAVRAGHFPQWLDLVATGRPAILLNFLPVSFGAIPYYVWGGYSSVIFHGLLIIDFIALLAGFLLLGRELNWPKTFSYLAFIFFLGLGFVKVFFAFGFYNTTFIFIPLQLFLFIRLSKDPKTLYFLLSTVVLFLQTLGNSPNFAFFCYTGGFIAYWSCVYVYSPAIKNNLKKHLPWCLFIFTAPVLMTLFQQYYILDVLKTADRFKGELMVSALKPTAWLEFLDSFCTSSYTATLPIIFIVSILAKGFLTRFPHLNLSHLFWRGFFLLIAALFGTLLLLNYQFLSNDLLITDFIPLLNSNSFRLVAMIYMAQLALPKPLARLSIPESYFILCVYSVFLYSPTVALGFEADFFQLLPVTLRVLIMLGLILGVQARRSQSIAIVGMVLLLGVYLCRAHLQVLSVRLLGIPWYMTRDGMIVNLGIVLLLISGLTIVAQYRAKQTVYFAALLFLVMFVKTREDFYSSKVHAYAGVVNPQAETDVQSMGKKLKKAMDGSGYIRFAQWGNLYQTPSAISGSLIPFGVPEGTVYDNAVISHYRHLYYNVIQEGKFVRSKGLNEFVPNSLLPANLLRTLDLNAQELENSYYRNALLVQYYYDVRTQFFWDLLQVQYVAAFGTANDPNPSTPIQTIDQFAEAKVKLYKNRNVEKSFRLGLLAPQHATNINSDTLDLLRATFEKVQFVDDKSLSMLKRTETTRTYRIRTSEAKLFIELESWHPHWKAKIDGKPAEIGRAFHIYRSLPLPAGDHLIELEYKMPYLGLTGRISLLSTLFMLGLSGLSLFRVRSA